MSWYLKAAAQGRVLAQNNIGYLYEHGLGVRADSAQAVEWYRKAADQGDPTGQMNLGVMYETGRGVPQDLVQAHARYSIAVSRFADARKRDAATKARDAVAVRMTPDQIADAKGLASAWQPAK
jgi:TPR repeat protein